MFRYILQFISKHSFIYLTLKDIFDAAIEGDSISVNHTIIKEKCFEIGTLDSCMVKTNIKLSVLGNKVRILGAALMVKTT